ncbi:SDR family oxidoreductase [Deinococcus koreensis]|uniref:NAD(P)-dependent oxidoreductase n=1 Tax=Deinococcus koreensis TaxID=2054903 RepID=A0A2K3UW25_9DEIO|nr:NmrA family NAD(P)-binding protein [Deinococcus koreensis]PNY80743.1 NAD(P)-dependent oxidoreductase [Deinococcus koreensis]
MILVVGATGNLGFSICSELAGRGYSLRAVVRPSSDPGRVEALRQLGAEPALADLKDPASLRRACDGVDTVITTATTTLRDQESDSIADVDLQGGRNLVEAARQAGVNRYVFLSFPEAADGPQSFPLAQAKRAVEQAWRQSGMRGVILQAALFVEFWLSPAAGFDAPNASARVVGAGTAQMPWVSLRDVARAVAACLEHPEWDGTLSVVAENLSMNEVIRVFEEVGGNSFTIQTVPQAALEAQRAQATSPLDQSFAGLMLSQTRGVFMTPDTRLAELHPTFTTVRGYASSVLGAPAAPA